MTLELSSEDRILEASVPTDLFVVVKLVQMYLAAGADLPSAIRMTHVELERSLTMRDMEFLFDYLSAERH